MDRLSLDMIPKLQQVIIGELLLDDGARNHLRDHAMTSYQLACDALALMGAGKRVGNGVEIYDEPISRQIATNAVSLLRAEFALDRPSGRAHMRRPRSRALIERTTP